MPTKQDNRLDPGQQEYEKNFDFERHERELNRIPSSAGDNPAEQASMDRAGAWARDSRPAAEREAAPSWSTNLTPGRSGGGKGKNPISGRFSLKNMLKKRVNQWILGGVASLLLTISAAVPAALSGALINMKEIGSDWANKNNHSLSSKWSAKSMEKKYMQAEDGCDTGTKCRFKKGIDDKTLQKFKDAGLNPEVKKVGKKQFVVAFNTTNEAGEKVRITKADFQQNYRQNVKFRGQMDTVAKPKAMLLRGGQTLKLVFNKFGIKRNIEISGKDDKERQKNFRRAIYGKNNEGVKALNAPAGEDAEDTAEKISEAEESIQEAADEQRQLLEGSDFDKAPDIVPDATNLDLDPEINAGQVAGDIAKGGIKGAALGIFGLMDKACTGYQLIRTVTFGAKIYKVAALIQYAGIFMTIADKVKAGDGAAPEMAFVMGLLFRPSSQKDSFGKTFFQSEGFNLISQNKIADQRGLARFTGGSSFLKFLEEAKKVFEGAGANRSTCKQVQSWYGTAIAFALNLGATFLTAGTINVAGIVASVPMSVIFSVIEAYATPLIVQYAAGTSSPDPTDPEGGYGIGNAIAVGLSAFGMFTGKANGARILSTSDAAAVEMEANQEMAFEKRVENYGKNPFSLDNASSVTSQLALAIAPAATAPLSQGSMQSLASIITSPFSLLSSSMGNILTNGASAQSDINRGGQFCNDQDYREMNVAVDANCIPIAGEKAATLDAKDPEAVDQWMFANGHADPDTGELKSDDAKKYYRSCIDSQVPLSPDGGGIDTTEDIDTRWCADPADKFTNFRLYQASNAFEEAEAASIEGTLGLDVSAAPATDGDIPGLTGKEYPNGKIPASALCALGSPWGSHRLRCDAAAGFKKLAAAFKADFGKDIKLTDSYRSYEGQVDCRARKGNTCAVPGTSNHGCGQAIDFASNINSYSSAEHKWMVANASKYGWTLPGWAQKNGSKPEPWHWEFATGGDRSPRVCQT